MIKDDDEYEYQAYRRKEQREYLLRTYHIREWIVLFGYKNLKEFRL